MKTAGLPFGEKGLQERQSNAVAMIQAGPQKQKEVLWMALSGFSGLSAAP